VNLARRILVTVVVTAVVFVVAINWIAPAALALYAARRAPKVTRVLPTHLIDTSISQAPGERLSYFGYEFEVPWSDLDPAQTRLYPKGHPHPNRAVLTFRSGLRLMVTALPPDEWRNNIAAEMKISPEQLESAFGRDMTDSDYTFVKALYEFTPAEMHFWRASQKIQSREQILLIVKSLAPLKSAETGIFDIQNQDVKGFQQGDPRAAVDKIAVNLYSDAGSAEFIFSESGRKPLGITQPEINRIIQSLRRSGPEPSEALSRTAH
jgi:hypothetical protein